MARVLFTSDLHLGHHLVASLRGFRDVKSHDDALARNWRKSVNPQDLVWVQGDLCLGNPEYALHWLSELPGRKRLLFGNHDNGHPLNKPGPMVWRRYLDVFETMDIAGRVSIEGRKFLLSHFPYVADRGETRHLQWRLQDLGAWLIHGHVHSPKKTVGPRQIHIGLDAWDLKPVTSDQIIQQMNEMER